MATSPIIPPIPQAPSVEVRSPVVISSPTISAMNLDRVSKVLQDLASSGSIVSKTTLQALLARKKALLVGNSSYDLRSVSMDELDSGSLSSGGGGSGGGSPFQVIEWDPITLRQESTLTFTPDATSIVTETSVYSTEVNPGVVQVGGPGFDIEFAVASAPVSSNLSGTFTLTDIRTDVYSPMMITFSSVPITAENLLTIFNGVGTNIGAVFQAVNLTAYMGSPQDTHYILSDLGNNINPNAIAVDPSTTHFTIDSGRIFTEDTEVSLAVDFDTYNIMSVIAFGDFVKVINSVHPNPVIPVTFINELTDVSVSASDIPDEATDGTVLKIMGHDGVLLGQDVLIGDECTLFNDLSEFLLDRPFNTEVSLSLNNRLLSDAVVDVRTYKDTSSPIYITKPVSAITYTSEGSFAPPILIGDEVRSGTITLVNRRNSGRYFFFAGKVPFKVVDETGAEVGGSFYEDSQNYNYAPYMQANGGIIHLNAYTASTYTLSGDGAILIIKKESTSLTESVSDLSAITDDIYILNDINHDGIIQVSEQNEDATISFRVSLANKKAGYLLTLSCGFNDSLGQSVLLFDETNSFGRALNSLIFINQNDIDRGYIGYTLRLLDVNAPLDFTLTARFSLSKDGSGGLNLLVGDQATKGFTYHVDVPFAPIDIQFMSFYSDKDEMSLNINDPLDPLSDINPTADIEATYSGVLTFSWGGGSDIVAGTLLKIATLISASGGKTSANWDDQLTKPIIDGVVDGTYVITQNDINNSTITLPFTASDSYPEQFLRFTVYLQRPEDDQPGTDPTYADLFIHGADPLLPLGGFIALTDNIDTAGFTPIPEVTKRYFTELLSGATTSNVQIYTPILGARVVVDWYTSDLPNTGYGSGEMAIPEVIGMDTYVFTQEDVDAGQVTTVFPITFTTPNVGAPYFIKSVSYLVDDATGNRITEDIWYYFIVYPQIGLVGITGDSSVVAFGDLVFTPPADAYVGDTLAVSDSSLVTLGTGYTPIGFPFNVVLDSSSVVSYDAYTQYSYGYSALYTIDVTARILRNNPSNIPVKGLLNTFTVTVNPRG